MLLAEGLHRAPSDERFDVDPATAIANAVRLVALLARPPLARRIRELAQLDAIRSDAVDDLARVALSLRRHLDALGGTWLPEADARALARLPLVARALTLRSGMLDAVHAVDGKLARALRLAEANRVDFGGLVYGLRRVASVFLSAGAKLEAASPALRPRFVAAAALTGADELDRKSVG